MSEFQLNDPPSDGISSVKFSNKHSQYILVSSWDAQVRLYDIDANKLKDSYSSSYAVLDCCFTDISHSFSGGIDKTLKCYDFNSQKVTIIGTHAEVKKKSCKNCYLRSNIIKYI